jgi:hypothetical protein
MARRGRWLPGRYLQLQRVCPKCRVRCFWCRRCHAGIHHCRLPCVGEHALGNCLCLERHQVATCGLPLGLPLLGCLPPVGTTANFSVTINYDKRINKHACRTLHLQRIVGEQQRRQYLSLNGYTPNYFQHGNDMNVSKEKKHLLCTTQTA